MDTSIFICVTAVLRCGFIVWGHWGGEGLVCSDSLVVIVVNKFIVLCL